MSNQLFDHENILKTIPNEPGCYLMKDKKGEIVYIGKAKNLKKRVKNYFYQLFTPFFNQIPKLTEYIYTSEILNPIEIKMPYQEDFELNIELLDKDYEFTGENHRKIQIKDSFYLPKGIILNSEYKKFYENIKNFIYKRKNMLNNIRIIKKIKE